MDWVVFSNIASICSVIGLLLSIVILIATLRVNAKVKKIVKSRKDKEKYNKRHKSIHLKLLEFQYTLHNEEESFESLNEVQGLIYELLRYDGVFRWYDKMKLKKCKKQLDLYPENFNRKFVISTLGYFSSKCKEEEEIA